MSVLADVKAMLGIEWNNYDFDEELKIYINSALSTLEMLGAPTRGTVEDQAVTWPQLLGPANPPEIKPFVYLKVRQLFDPPQNAFLVSALQHQLDELSWRITVHYSRYKGGVDLWKPLP